MTILTANAVTVEQMPKQLLSKTLGAEYTKEEIAELVNEYASRYRVDGDKMMHTIECESRYKNVQSNLYHSNGVREDSWGIAQINLYWNRDVTKEQALDPYFAVNWMAQAFSNGQERKWSCYRILYP